MLPQRVLLAAQNQSILSAELIDPVSEKQNVSLALLRRAADSHRNNNGSVDGKL